MESQKENENKNQAKENNPKNGEEISSTSKTKSDQLDLKKLITKIDNRVRTKVFHKFK